MKPYFKNPHKDIPPKWFMAQQVAKKIRENIGDGDVAEASNIIAAHGHLIASVLETYGRAGEQNYAKKTFGGRK
ncbi:hypothetical protein LZD49_33620 [Dyadobacter sp. CY261]|uniref:hypothetical protein n=1 Tax=Dyadobacter sp. CY261 TaxID=2907203 RepID=UPI001F390D6D|nr:hypothetical protein [Dyadobacter sp. CY261]MCF0075467.1 hypothetical protein [Dyadobacter sp. CY261]